MPIPLLSPIPHRMCGAPASRSAARLSGRLALWLLAGLFTLPAARGQPMVTTPAGNEAELRHMLKRGGVVVEYDYYTDEEGDEVKHGEYRRYYLNGEMQELITYAHGRKHGRFVYYHEADAKKVEGHYRHGQLHGEIRRYYSSGQLRREATFREGTLQGPFTTYYRNGQVHEEGAYRDGRRHGAYTEHRRDGTLLMTGTYRAGRLSGEVTLYDEQGQPRARGVLRDDLISGPWTCIRPDDRNRVRKDCDGAFYTECSCS